MKQFCKSLSLSFAAGAFGALICALFIWLCGNTGVTAHFDVKIAPQLTKSFLYPKIVWGGIWGGLFLLPYLKRSYFFRGLLFSILPTLITLLVILPFVENKGFLGTRLGDNTPIFIFLFNAVWGISAGLWLQYLEK